MPGPYTDQKGNHVSLDELCRLTSEAILANVMAFDLAGLPRIQVKMIVGPDGGTIIGAGALFQTPLGRRLTDADGRRLFETFQSLLADYDAGRIPEDRLNRIRQANNTEKKIEAIVKHLREAGEHDA